MQTQQAYFINILGLLALCGILLTAVGVQIIGQEMPCPLCLLQRMAFVGVGIGLTLNLTVGLKPKHYGIVVVSSLLGMAMSGRQVLLHIVPPDPGYGDPLMGYHMYTWAFIAFFLIILITGVLLFMDSQFAKAKNTKLGDTTVKLFGFTVGLILLLAFLECGIMQCPDNPVKYIILSSLGF